LDFLLGKGAAAVMSHEAGSKETMELEEEAPSHFSY